MQYITFKPTLWTAERRQPGQTTVFQSFIALPFRDCIRELSQTEFAHA